MTEKSLFHKDSIPESKLVMSKLAIDRCRNHVTHLHALIHTCGCGCESYDEAVMESARIIIAGLELDLDCSANSLSKAI